MTDERVDPLAFKTWTAAAQERALEELQARTRRPWTPYWCTKPDCNGKPHDEWTFNHARADQRPPTDSGWLAWLLLSGRGSGKTRTGSEYLHRLVDKVPRVGIIGATAPDIRGIMLEGEALELSTPIATPSGFTTMGEIAEGDEVLGPDGEPTKVLWCSLVTEGRPCYRVSFADGTSIVADAEHKWVVTHVVNGNRAIKTTADLAPQKRQARWYIDAAQPLDLPAADLPIPPYTLGAWLGDGSARGAEITTMDHEVLDGVIRDGFALGYTYNNGSRATCHNVLGLRKRLRLAGLLRNKHVPDEYLRASFAQRLDLLRGLMDTDGYVSPRGQCAFDGKNRRLVEAVADLCATLGIKAAMRQRDNMWRVTFSTALPVVTITRKRDRLQPPRSPEVRRHHIVAVEAVPSVPVRCIAVEADHDQYLVTKRLIATHNSGLLTIARPDHRPIYEPSKRKVTWPNGAVGLLFSAEEPDRLRGPEHYAVWWDEPAHAPLVQDCWDNMMFGLRLGQHPRVVLTTTPKPRPWLKAVIAEATTRIARASTYDNLDNLAPVFAERVISKYEGTRLGRQELHGELLEDVEGALWQYDMIEVDRVAVHPHLDHVVVSVDPAGSVRRDRDETGIIVIGRSDDHLYVLADLTGRYTPHGWATAVDAAYDTYKADAIVAEDNYGGDMVESNLSSVGITKRIHRVNSRRGKAIRAEPIVALYEQHKVHHVGVLGDLETEMTEWEAYDPNQPSPNRVDSLVHGATHLMKPRGIASIASPTQLRRDLPRHSARTATHRGPT